jgi:hypothetical protein
MSLRSHQHQDFSPFRSGNQEISTAYKKPPVADYSGYEDRQASRSRVMTP